MRCFARVLGRDVSGFANAFTVLREAYRQGSMEYGLFVARSPRAS